MLMVTVGGATRLTDSGLSITEWRPIVGMLPPLSDADWQNAFAKYKQIPEYHLVNRGMSLEAFKAIFWWEWGHRFLGRIIGLAFGLPLVWFWLRGRITGVLRWKLAGILALGALQGAIGWYMVTSGLVDRIDVSQYRLALHLGVAVIILGALVWVALDLRHARSRPRSPHASDALAATSLVIVAAVFLQVIAGAFVAGMKAGLSYNTWPLMDGSLVPSGLGAMSPWWLNLFENAATVQFNHRMIAYAVVALTCWQAWRAIAHTTPPDRARSTALMLFAAVLMQSALGIWTLLAGVPLWLGLAHQAGAMTVFVIAVAHAHAAQRPAELSALPAGEPHAVEDAVAQDDPVHQRGADMRRHESAEGVGGPTVVRENARGQVLVLADDLGKGEPTGDIARAVGRHPDPAENRYQEQQQVDPQMRHLGGDVLQHVQGRLRRRRAPRQAHESPHHHEPKHDEADGLVPGVERVGHRIEIGRGAAVDHVDAHTQHAQHEEGDEPVQEFLQGRVAIACGRCRRSPWTWI
jgi:cytochrome c oxidase assembly protein subunit 15